MQEVVALLFSPANSKRLLVQYLAVYKTSNMFLVVCEYVPSGSILAFDTKISYGLCTVYDPCYVCSCLSCYYVYRHSCTLPQTDIY